jgi:hypothetical protein
MPIDVRGEEAGPQTPDEAAFTCKLAEGLIASAEQGGMMLDRALKLLSRCLGLVDPQSVRCARLHEHIASAIVQGLHHADSGM